MDIVYAHLDRRAGLGAQPSGEASEVLGALWAHAMPEDGLEHASVRSQGDRVDLLMYLLTLDSAAPDFRPGTHRADTLLRRCYSTSPLLRRRYLPPSPLG
ncbi:hypothetical protein [Streptomyces sp. NBC_00083]|uniref:hypothetical protein n=1 Tax=Streptomyces sp. NBC_00083 TaxID=2975647 RepID=UPI00225168E3|nr:hypothetical protein [Streptomyces sp. NBC_00083]MCX5382027.1 hypothetical protein [Streptomyces sp. NBC_00083]